MSKSRWSCNLVRYFVGLRVCLFLERSVFRSPLWLMHLWGMLTMWMSELRLHVCVRACVNMRQRGRECPFDQAFIIVPDSSLDFDLALSSCQPSTFPLSSFHFCVETTTALWCLTSRQSTPIVLSFVIFVFTGKSWPFLPGARYCGVDHHSTVLPVRVMCPWLWACVHGTGVSVSAC